MVPGSQIDAQIIAKLKAHAALCQEVLALVQQESQALRQSQLERLAEFSGRRKSLLPRLTESLREVRASRLAWEQIPASERSSYPEVNRSLKQTQEMILRALTLDRENEQALLRQGLMSPRKLPAAELQRPNFVANLYRRNSA